MPRQEYGKWISHNRVLGSVDLSKKPNERARNPNFDSDETQLLISLWGSPKVQKTLLTVHKKHPVIQMIAEQMKRKGYNRTTEEVNTRIKNLKCLYNRIRKELDSGLLQGKPQWKHYDAMNEILSRPIFGGKDLPSVGGREILMQVEQKITNAADLNCHIKIEKEEFNESMEVVGHEEDLSTGLESEIFAVNETRVKTEPPENHDLEIDQEKDSGDMKYEKRTSSNRSRINIVPTNLMISKSTGQSSSNKHMKILFVKTSIPQPNSKLDIHVSNGEDMKDTSAFIGNTKKSKNSYEEREKFPTIKNILNNIHNELKIRNKIDMERTELEKLRFEHEKQRFEYEKSFASEIMNILHNKASTST